MCITKIHPIHSTLHLAISYITDDKKTKEQVLVSSQHCHPKTAHLQFLETRQQAKTHGNVLARHLIQSFFPGEVSPKKAHEIGLELCQKIFKGQYEFVLATHVDRGHIHNHIIFNNVNFVTQKCYQSNKKSYHRIHYQSDKLCEKYGLLVIDEDYQLFRKKFHTKGKSFAQLQAEKKGKSWISKLQFTIDRNLEKAKSWENFLTLMNQSGYEVKTGKHIAFRHESTPRFTRAKTIGTDYTEEKLQERLKQKKKFIKVIKPSKPTQKYSKPAYQNWLTKHNLQAMAQTRLSLLEHSIHSQADLEELIISVTARRQTLMTEIGAIEKDMDKIGDTIEHLHTVKQFSQAYDYAKKHPEDKNFMTEYRAILAQYKASKDYIEKLEKPLPTIKSLLLQLEIEQEKKNTLMREYSNINQFSEQLHQLKRNHQNYFDRDRGLD